MNHVIMSKNVGKYGSLLFPKRRGTAISGKGIGLCLLQVLYCSPLEVEMNGNPQRNLQQKYAKIWIFHFSPDLMPCASPSTGFPGGPNLCRPRTSDVGTLKIIDTSPIQKVRQKPNEPPKNMESSGGLWRAYGGIWRHGKMIKNVFTTAIWVIQFCMVQEVQDLDQLQRQSFVTWVWNTWDAEPKSWKERTDGRKARKALRTLDITGQTQFASLWPSKPT